MARIFLHHFRIKKQPYFLFPLNGNFLMDTSPQHIVHLLENEQFDQAIAKCTELLDRGIKHPQLWLFLAIAHGRKGNTGESEKWFEALINEFGQNPHVHYNRGLVFQENGQLNKAIEAYRKAVSMQPAFAPAWHNMGLAQLDNSQAEAAIHALEEAVRHAPDNPLYRLHLAEALNARNAYGAAVPHWQTLAASDSAEAEIFCGYISALVALRHLAEASLIAEKALSAYPDNPQIWQMVGRLELEKRKLGTALFWLEKCHAAQPENKTCLQDLATALSLAGEHHRARPLLEALLANASDASDYAFVAEQMLLAGDYSKASHLLESALVKHPDDFGLQVLKARALRTLKQLDSALAILDQLDNKTDKTVDAALIAEKYYEQGAVFDKKKHFDKAWHAFLQANETMQKEWRKINPHPDTFLNNAHSLAQGFTPESLPAQSTTAFTDVHQADSPKLVFVLGFPRSGTTLIDNILSAHPEVSILEEAPILGEVFDQIANANPATYAKAISQLDSKQVTHLRQRYFSLLPDYLAREPTTTVIDKSPMNTLHVGLIHRLFPDAKILFAQRHPADVVLSCFMQNFYLNSFMTNLLDIDHAARTYDAMLKVWTSATEQWNIPYYPVVYEKLVSDFEPQARQLVAQAGLAWHDDILRYHEKTAERGTITTPSYNQASQPVYTSSRFRHRNYLPYMQQALKILQPWITRLGYSEERPENRGH